MDGNNTLLRSENESQQLVDLGLQNTMVITMKDAVLIADAIRSQDI